MNDKDYDEYTMLLEFEKDLKKKINEINAQRMNDCLFISCSIKNSMIITIEKAYKDALIVVDYAKQIL